MPQKINLEHWLKACGSVRARRLSVIAVPIDDLESSLIELELARGKDEARKKRKADGARVAKLIRERKFGI
jgi:hypothetical protein